MASNTEYLGLLMKDPAADKADTFNIETMLNENWRKIDAAFPELISLIEGRAQVVSGTVTGNSNAGEDEPNSITFPFVPKMVYVTRAERSPLDAAGFVKFDNFLWVEGVTKDAIGQNNYGTKYRCYELVGNTLSWWVDDTNYGAAVIGRYIAFG